MTEIRQDIVKRAFTIEEQIQLLSKRGMIFDNIQDAKTFLEDIGYYRLGFFSFPFEKSFPKKTNRTHELRPGTTFSQVRNLYNFDSNLRYILIRALTKIEINIRTRITHLGSLHHISDPWWFCNPKYMNKGFLKCFDKEVYAAIKRNPAIMDHHKKHPNDRYAPAWKTMEFMTMGNIVFLYEAIKNLELKQKIAREYGCSIKVFLNYLETLRLVRNRCAHGGCLYNLNIDKGISSKPANVNIADSHNIKGAILVIMYFLKIISPEHWQEVLKKINFELEKISQNTTTQEVINRCTNFGTNFIP